MRNIVEKFRRHIDQRRFNQPEMRFHINQELEEAGNILFYYAEDTRTRLKPLTVPNYLVTNLYDLKKSNDEGRIRVGVHSFDITEEKVIATYVLGNDQCLSQLDTISRRKDNLRIIKYILDIRQEAFLFLLICPNDLLDTLPLRSQEGPRRVESIKGGGELTYLQVGTKEKLILNFPEVRMNLSRLSPIKRESDGIIFDIWGAFVGVGNPPSGNERIPRMDLDPVPALLY